MTPMWGRCFWLPILMCLCAAVALASEFSLLDAIKDQNRIAVASLIAHADVNPPYHLGPRGLHISEVSIDKKHPQMTCPQTDRTRGGSPPSCQQPFRRSFAHSYQLSLIADSLLPRLPIQRPNPTAS